ncbi:MAG TPA: hypothetical protein VH988_36225 [Thermoanaerobaculia bacterium]|jgi:hypothetical protein|nr:hypothetical protein [Thermoanaerobaculia bacterium]
MGVLVNVFFGLAGLAAFGAWLLSPGRCPTCRGPQRRLPEEERLDHLTAAEKSEEALGVRHAVWECRRCGDIAKARRATRRKGSEISATFR